MSNNIEPVADENPADPGRPGMGMGIGEEVPALRPRRRFPTQLLVLALIVSVSAAALFAMRRYGMRSGFKFDAVDVDYKDDSEKARTYERIMADLASVQKPLDVALGDFGKSPFMRENSTKITPDVLQLPIAQKRRGALQAGGLPPGCQGPAPQRHHRDHRPHRRAERQGWRHRRQHPLDRQGHRRSAPSRSRRTAMSTP